MNYSTDMLTSKLFSALDFTAAMYRTKPTVLYLVHPRTQQIYKVVYLLYYNFSSTSL